MAALDILCPWNHDQIPHSIPLKFLLFPYRFYSSLWRWHCHQSQLLLPVARATFSHNRPGTVVESVEHWSRVRETVGSNPAWVKAMTYQIDTCRFPARCSALLGYGKDWLAQCQDNVTDWGITSWCWRPGFPVGQHYKVATSVHCHK